MSHPRDIEVEFEQLDAAHGGSNHLLVTNSRPQFYYLGLDWDCRLEIIASGAPNPLIGVRAFISFLSPAEHFGRLDVGSVFLLREAQRTIAFGKVLRLVDLERNADTAKARPGYSPDPRMRATEMALKETAPPRIQDEDDEP